MLDSITQSLLAMMDNRDQHDSAFQPKFYKTMMCTFWRKRGFCRNSSCFSAHGEHELLPNPHTGVVNRCSDFFRRGFCPMGLNCLYSHGGDEADNSNPKTRWCPTLRDAGNCFNRVACKYAHSREELSTQLRAYKTTLCPAFRDGGRCPQVRCRLKNV